MFSTYFEILPVVPTSWSTWQIFWGGGFAPHFFVEGTDPSSPPATPTLGSGGVGEGDVDLYITPGPILAAVVIPRVCNSKEECMFDTCYEGFGPSNTFANNSNRGLHNLVATPNCLDE